MKYRKRPVIVEATRWFPGLAVPGVHDQGYEGKPYVVTIHQGQRAYLEPGDWVITEADGIHHYPCTPDVFAATYQMVIDGETEDTDGSPTNQDRQGYETPRITILLGISSLPNPGVNDLLAAFAPIIGTYGGSLSIVLETDDEKDRG